MNSNDAKYCETHNAWVSPWYYEDELGREVCATCYSEYWTAQDDELWSLD